MKIQCDRQELADRLQALGTVVSGTPTTKPILQDYHLKAVGDQLLVEATDLDVSARVRVERADVEEEGHLALPGGRFLSLVREIPAASVRLESLEEGRGAVVRAEGYDFKLLGDDPEQFPEVPSFEGEGSFRISREGFLQTLRRVGVAASRDPTRYQLAGVYFELDGEKLILTATDGRRLATDEIRVSANGLAASCIVPNRAVDVLLKVLAQADDEIRIALRATEIQVSFAAGEFAGKLIEGTFPEYRKGISEPPVIKALVRRTDLLAAVRSAALVTSRDTATVSFRFHEGAVSLASQASDIGESRIEVPAELEGGEMEIRFNPVYFLDGLRSVDDERIRLELVAPNRPASIRGGQHYRYFLMPLVLKTDAEG